MTPAELAPLWEHRLAVRDILKEYESDWDVVDDLMQETYLRALEATYDGKSEPLTWLCGIAKRVGGHHLERATADKRRFEVLEVYVEQSTDETGEEIPYYDRGYASEYIAEASAALDPALIVEAEDTYASALSTMPPQMALVVQMRREGIPNPEIARELGVSDKRIRNLVQESRDYFRDNREFNRTNSVCERERSYASGVVSRVSNEANERACAQHFASRDSVWRKRRVRLDNPGLTLQEWRNLYDVN